MINHVLYDLSTAALSQLRTVSPGLTSEQCFRSGATVPLGQMAVKDICSSSVSPRTSSSISERSSWKTGHVCWKCSLEPRPPPQPNHQTSRVFAHSPFPFGPALTCDTMKLSDSFFLIYRFGCVIGPGVPGCTMNLRNLSWSLTDCLGLSVCLLWAVFSVAKEEGAEGIGRIKVKQVKQMRKN